MNDMMLIVQDGTWKPFSAKRTRSIVPDMIKRKAATNFAVCTNFKFKVQGASREKHSSQIACLSWP
jgi:hypothetical protein